MTGFWFTGILLALYLFHIVEKFYQIPWLKIEFVFCAVWTGLYLIAACVAVSFHVEAYIAAGVRYLLVSFKKLSDSFRNCIDSNYLGLLL